MCTFLQSCWKREHYYSLNNVFKNIYSKIFLPLLFNVKMLISRRSPKSKKKKKKSVWGAKRHTFSTAFPSVWRAAACFLTVCKIELDAVGNLTSRQTCIFFSLQVLVFLVFPSLSPLWFSQLQLPSDIVSMYAVHFYLHHLPQLCVPSHPTVSRTRSTPPPPHTHPLSVSSSGQPTPCHQRWSETGHVHPVPRGRVCYQLKVSMRPMYAKPCP